LFASTTKSGASRAMHVPFLRNPTPHQFGLQE
jgi:hypothetical protein